MSAIPETPPPGVQESLLTNNELRAFTEEFPDSALAVMSLDGDPPVATGDLDDPFAWSTIKVLMAAQAIRDSDGVDRLPEPLRQDISAALRASDNAAAARLWEDLIGEHGSAMGAAGAMEEMLREARDSTTRVSTEPRGQFSPYGQTRWQPRDQALFMGALARFCLLSPADTEWLLREMREVIPDQRWGVIQEFGGAVKGGWGPDDDGAYLVRQFGVVPAPGGGEFVVAAATRSPSGTFGEGIDSLGEISRWLAERVGSAPDSVQCNR